jgi:repressor LexA
MTIPTTRARMRDFIAHYIARNGFAPSVREIQRGVGLHSTGAVHYQLRALEAAGEIRRQRYLSRAITLLTPEHPKDRSEPVSNSTRPPKSSRLVLA